MAQADLLKCAVQAASKTYEFEAVVHRSENPAGQQIDIGFYLEWAKKLLEGTHHELELVKSPVWRRVNPRVPIHIHKHPETGKHYVCYIFKVGTMEQAEDIFRQWCVLTTYSICFDEDGAALAYKHSDNFFEVMAARYNIRIVE